MFTTAEAIVGYALCKKKAKALQSLQLLKLRVTIKKKLDKQKHQLVTCQEFCEFAGLSLEDVRRSIR